MFEPQVAIAHKIHTILQQDDYGIFKHLLCIVYKNFLGMHICMLYYHHVTCLATEPPPL